MIAGSFRYVPVAWTCPRVAAAGSTHSADTTGVVSIRGRLRRHASVVLSPVRVLKRRLAEESDVPDGVTLLLGVLAAAAGGELFVRGAVGLAAWLRVPAGIIGATVAAFATSTPEFSVAELAQLVLQAALAHH